MSASLRGPGDRTAGGRVALVLVAIGVALVFAWSPARAQTETRLTVADCLELAFERNFDIKQAIADAEQSRGSYVGSWANVLPQISADASGGKTISIDAPTFTQSGVFLGRSDEERVSYGLGASVRQSLINLERYYSFKSSKRAWQGTQTGLRATHQDVAIDVITKFYEVVKNRRNVELRRETLQLSEDQLRKTDALFELGAVPKADVLESRVSVSRSRRDLISAENEYLISQGRLNLSLGGAVGEGVQLAYEPLDIPAELPAPATALQEARGHRPDLEQIQMELEAARLSRKSSWWANLPSLNGSLSFSKASDDFGTAFDFASLHNLKSGASWRYSVALSVPIFDGLVTKGQKIRAAGAYARSREALAKKERELQLEVNESILNLGAARASLEVSADEIASAEENLRLREAMYDHGASTILELIQARVDLTNARFDAITNETRMQLTWYEYMRAIGVDLRTGQAFQTRQPN